MNKMLLWVLAAIVVAGLIIYFFLPFIGTQVAALIVGAIGAITGLFFRRKRTA